MNHSGKTSNFWLGNAILAAAMAMLLFMGPLSERMGVWAMVLWAALALAGAYLLMTGRDEDGPSD